MRNPLFHVITLANIVGGGGANVAPCQVTSVGAGANSRGGGGEMSWTHYIHAAFFQWYSLTNYLISIKSYDF